MEIYFHLIPSDINSSIVRYFNSDDLNNFISINEYLISEINWGNIFFQHFDYYKNVDYDEYLRYLSIEKLKKELNLNLNWSIEKILNLKRLSLSYNKIKEIPKEIGGLKFLQFLSFSNNKIIEIPKEIGNLINLQYLYLSNNKIKEIPKEIGELKVLQEFYLFNTEIKELPKEIGGLTSLQTLSLVNNEINELPKEIGELTSLTHLYLYNNPLTMTKIKINSFFSQKLNIYI